MVSMSVTVYICYSDWPNLCGNSSKALKESWQCQRTNIIQWTWEPFKVRTTVHATKNEHLTCFRFSNTKSFSTINLTLIILFLFRGVCYFVMTFQQIFNNSAFNQIVWTALYQHHGHNVRRGHTKCDWFDGWRSNYLGNSFQPINFCLWKFHVWCRSPHLLSEEHEQTVVQHLGTRSKTIHDGKYYR